MAFLLQERKCWTEGLKLSKSGHLGGSEVHDSEGRGLSREVSHPLRDRSRLTNAWVEGGVVGALARQGSSGGWLFLDSSSSSTLIPLFTRSLFPYSPDVFPSWKSKGFTSPLFQPHTDALASLWGELAGWRWEGLQLRLSNYSFFFKLVVFLFGKKTGIVPFFKKDSLSSKSKRSAAFYAHQGHTVYQIPLNSRRQHVSHFCFYLLKSCFTKCVLLIVTSLGCLSFTLQNDVRAQFHTERLLWPSAVGVGKFLCPHLKPQFNASALKI